MTESEAIEVLKQPCNCDYDLSATIENCGISKCDKREATKMAIKALEEVQQYRALEQHLSDMFGGTLTLEQVVDSLERQLTEPDSPHPLKARILTYKEASDWDAYREIGTVEECRAAVEKQIPKKQFRISEIDENDNADVECPVCHYNSNYSIRSITRGHCWKCGQLLDWGDEQ